MKSKNLVSGLALCLSVVTLLFGLSDCKKKDTPKDPQSCFNSDKQKVIDSQVVTFTNCSSNASSYEWDFGDGTSSTITTPTKSYSDKGTYTVRMTASGNGKQSTATQNLIVGTPYVDKIVINNVNIPPRADSPTISTRVTDFRLSFDGGRTWEADIANPVLPLTIPINSLHRMEPGIQSEVHVHVVTAVEIFDQDLLFTPDRATQQVHAYDSNSRIDMDVYRKVQ